jgi:hypothetical protein
MKQLLSTITLALGLAGLNPIQAQQPQPPANENATTAVPKNAWERQVAELVFVDETYEFIAGLLRHYFPEFNFIVEEGFQKEVAPAVAIRNSRIHGILAALEASSPNTRAALVTDNIVSIGPRTAAISTNTAKPDVQTFNVRGYLFTKTHHAKDESAREEAVDKALRELEQLVAESWSMLQEADSSLRQTPPPRLRMHKGTQMLISVGNPDQLRVIEEIVNNLPGMERFATDPATGAQIMVRPERRTESGPAGSR